MSLKNRVQRLEAIVFPHQRPRVPTEEEIRFGQGCTELLLRIDPVFVKALNEEDRLRHEASVKGIATPPMSNLFLGFGLTVAEHIRTNSPLEFPAIVGQAYLDAGDKEWRSERCLACRYPLPWFFSGIQFDHCPICLTREMPKSMYVVKAQ